MSIADHLGNVVAVARRALGQAFSKPGRQRFADVDLSTVERFVFICKANICRSAYAEARAQLFKVPAVSAGIEAQAGLAAAATARRLAAKRGVRLFAHRSTPITSLELLPGDLVICMEVSHAHAVAAAAAQAKAQVTLLGLWSQPPRLVIADPYEGSERAWSDCFRIIDVSLARLIADWRSARQAPEAH